MDNTLKIESVAEEKQYIMVNVGIEQYGIDIGNVDNIIRMQKITRVPKSQHYFYGVINIINCCKCYSINCRRYC